MAKRADRPLYCAQCAVELGPRRYKFCSRECTVRWWDAQPETRARKQAHQVRYWGERTEGERLAYGRRAYYRSKFGLTEAAYQAITERPCELCSAPPPTVVDHDHSTGRLRGALCPTCNKAIGMLGDSLAGVRRAVAYLEGSERVQDISV